MPVCAVEWSGAEAAWTGSPAAGLSAGSRWETEQRPRPCTRYGCFLPDLTGLARGLPAADLPPHYIISRHRPGKPRTAGDRSREVFSPLGSIGARQLAGNLTGAEFALQEAAGRTP